MNEIITDSKLTYPAGNTAFRETKERFWNNRRVVMVVSIVGTVAAVALLTGLMFIPGGPLFVLGVLIKMTLAGHIIAAGITATAITSTVMFGGLSSGAALSILLAKDYLQNRQEQNLLQLQEEEQKKMLLQQQEFQKQQKDMLDWLEMMKTVVLYKDNDPFAQLDSRIAFFKEIKSKITELPSDSSLNAIRECLCQNSPLFSQIWDRMNQDGSWQLISTDRIAKQKPVGGCSPSKRKISVEESLNNINKAIVIVFETLNGFQSKRHQKIISLAKQGILDREKYAQL